MRDCGANNAVYRVPAVCLGSYKRDIVFSLCVFILKKQSFEHSQSKLPFCNYCSQRNLTFVVIAFICYLFVNSKSIPQKDESKGIAICVQIFVSMASLPCTSIPPSPLERREEGGGGEIPRKMESIALSPPPIGLGRGVLPFPSEFVSTPVASAPVYPVGAGIGA